MFIILERFWSGAMVPNLRWPTTKCIPAQLGTFLNPGLGALLLSGSPLEEVLLTSTSRLNEHSLILRLKLCIFFINICYFPLPEKLPNPNYNTFCVYNPNFWHVWESKFIPREGADIKWWWRHFIIACPMRAYKYVSLSSIALKWQCYTKMFHIYLQLLTLRHL